MTIADADFPVSLMRWHVTLTSQAESVSSQASSLRGLGDHGRLHTSMAAAALGEHLMDETLATRNAWLGDAGDSVRYDVRDNVVAADRTSSDGLGPPAARVSPSHAYRVRLTRKRPLVRTDNPPPHAWPVRPACTSRFNLGSRWLRL